MNTDIRVAAIQTTIPTNHVDGENQIRRLVLDACKEPVDLVGLPEDCVAPLKDIKEGYQPFPFLATVAKEHHVYLFGANVVKEDDGYHNRGFVFNREGELIHTHDKVVLTPPEEQDGLIAGNTLEVFETEFGKMALLVCKDSFHRYAAWFFDQLRQAGADVILIPSYSLNVSGRSIELWTDSLKALAKWFDVYIMAPGTVGRNSTEFPSFGHALIVCPKRVVVAEGSFDKEEILRAILDVQSLEDIRNTYGSKWQPKAVPNVKLISKSE